MKYELKPLPVPTHVFVNLFNDKDYQPIPLNNITPDQLDRLVSNFVEEIYRIANKSQPSKRGLNESI